MRLGPRIPAGGSLPWLATDFGEYAVDSQLSSSDWTKRSESGGPTATWTATADASAVSGIAVQSNSRGNDVTSLTWDRLDGIGSSNFDLLALIKRSGFGAGTPAMCGLTCTGSSGEGGVAFGFNTTSQIEISQYSSGLYTGGTAKGFSSNTTTWYWLRWTRTNNSHVGKVWTYGSSQATATSVSRSAAGGGGFLGLFIVNTGGIRCAWLSAATGGDTAPGPG